MNVLNSLILQNKNQTRKFSQVHKHIKERENMRRLPLSLQHPRMIEAKEIRKCGTVANGETIFIILQFF